MIDFLTNLARTAARLSPFGVRLSRGQEIDLPENDPQFSAAIRGMTVISQYQGYPEYPRPYAGFLTVTDLKSIASLCPEGNITLRQAADVYGYLYATWIRQKVLDRRLAAGSAALFISLFLLNSAGSAALRILSQVAL